jgi:hypothetical protein
VLTYAVEPEVEGVPWEIYPRINCYTGYFSPILYLSLLIPTDTYNIDLYIISTEEDQSTRCQTYLYPNSTPRLCFK